MRETSYMVTVTAKEPSRSGRIDAEALFRDAEFEPITKRFRPGERGKAEAFAEKQRRLGRRVVFMFR